MNKIEIKCTSASTINIDSIEPFQGTLKKRTKEQINQIIKSIEKFGFSFPFFVWKKENHNWCLDGHGRLLALKEMKKQGYDLPDFPVSFIEAKDEEEAKQKLLRQNSFFGMTSIDDVLDFCKDVEVSEINIPGVEFINKTKAQLEEEKRNEIEKTLVPYKKVHILLSMTPDSFIRNEKKFKDISRLDGVEYVQSEN